MTTTRHTPTFQIDVSRTYRNKEGYKVGGYKLNTSFVTEPHTPESFIEEVVKPGWPYTMAHQKRSPKETGAAARNVTTPKHIENFVSRQELTADDDSKAPGVISFWLNDPWFSRWGYAFVESVNSQPEAEKGHPTIIFDRPVTDPDLYKEVMKAMKFKYDRLDPLNNIDRTIYNAEGARVHTLGNICPWTVFERDVLTPYRTHTVQLQAEREAERQRRLAEYEAARVAGMVETGDGAIEKYLKASIVGIFNWLATRTEGRHAALFGAGVLIGRLQASDWGRSFVHRFSGIDDSAIAAVTTNGYFDEYAHTDVEVLRTFYDGIRQGELEPAPAPMLYRTQTGKVQDASGFEPPQAFSLKPYKLSDEAKARRDKVLTEAKTRRGEKLAEALDRQEELERRYAAGDVIAFLGDEVHPVYLEERRDDFSSAKAWKDYVIEHWPDIDADEQYRIKLAENRESRPEKCGDYRKFVLPSGLAITRRWTCGICEECIKRGVWIYNRALDELYGIPRYDQARPVGLDELAGDAIPGDDAPRENAPPLPAIKGDLSLMMVATDAERIKLARELRRAGVNYRTQPLVWNNDIVFDFLINDNRGDPARLMLTDERLSAWVRGAENKRASGGLLPSLKKLQQRYRKALPYEVVMPELDDEGQPVDPDIFAFDLPDIGTSAKLPHVVIDFRVHNRDTLQAALIEINNQQHRILGRRGDVNYGVYSKKKFYTRYSTLDRLIEDFNTWQMAIRLKKGLPALE